MAAERIIFAVAVAPLLVAVDLVGCDSHHGAGLRQRPERFQQMQGANHIGVPGGERLGVAEPHQRLGGEVKHDLGLEGEHRCLERWQIGQIQQLGAQAAGQIVPLVQKQLLIKTGLGIRRQGHTQHLGTEIPQPKGQPGSLEAGVAS